MADWSDCVEAGDLVYVTVLNEVGQLVILATVAVLADLLAGTILAA